VSREAAPQLKCPAAFLYGPMNDRMSMLKAPTLNGRSTFMGIIGLLVVIILVILLLRLL